MRFTVESLSDFPDDEDARGAKTTADTVDEEVLSPQEELYNSLIQRAALTMLDVDYLRMEKIFKVAGNLGRILIEITAGNPYDSYQHDEFELLNNDELIAIRSEGVRFIITLDTKRNVVHLYETKFVDLDEEGLFSRDELIGKILTIDLPSIPQEMLQSSIELSNYILEKLVKKLEGFQKKLRSQMTVNEKRSARKNKPLKRYTMSEVWGPFINSPKIAQRFPSK